MFKRKYGSIAVILHLIAPGLGFLYASRPWAALSTILLLLGSVFTIAWSRLLLEPWGLWLLSGCLFIIYLMLAPVVFFLARRENNNTSKTIQSSIIYPLFAGIFLTLITLIIYFRATLFGYETFVLPSRSMATTLLPNDYIIVDRWAFIEGSPQQGDILVFKSPLSPKTYFIKRMIAGPNEKIIIENGKVSIDNKLLDEPYVDTNNNARTAKQKRIEKRVPMGHYFVLGDNRDHSNDSRYWGFLDENAIYGKAISIWFSFSAEDGIRVDRIKHLDNGALNKANRS